MTPFTLWLVRVANWLNWIVGALFAALLILILLNPGLFADRFAASFPTPLAGDAAYRWLVTVLGLSVPVVVLVHIALTRLAAIIRSVGEAAGLSFANAKRLTTVAWSLIGINLIDLAFGYASVSASEASGEYFGWAPSLTGWFAAALLFVLASIFRQGAAMREELEGTV